MADTKILSGPRGNHFEIVLNDPARRNPLSLEVITELRAALADAAASSCRGILLRSTGSVFCAGHDFLDLRGRDLAAMRELFEACGAMIQAIYRSPLPAMAEVQGLATGAGCQLALACDLVVAAEAAAFQTPGSQGGWFCTTPMLSVVRAVGRKRAAEMLFTGDRVCADLALEWGMVNRVVPSDRLPEAARTLLDRATRGSRHMLAAGKAAFYRLTDPSLESDYDYASDVMATTGVHPDAQGRIRSFLDRSR